MPKTAESPAPEAYAPLPDLEQLSVHGARVHNLRDLSLDIPRNRLVVLTGISGSGKSSLAFDTIYAEGQRRYLESFSAYARQFMGSMERPDVDKITGLSPVISIEQKTTSRNPRSTVGTVTEIYDFMRLLYARASEAYSWKSGKKMVRYTEEQILDALLGRFAGQAVYLLAPLVRGRKGHYRELFEQTRRQGYVKVRVDGEIRELAPKMQVDRYKVHDIDVVIDQLYAREEDRARLQRSVATAVSVGQGAIGVLEKEGGAYHTFSRRLMCPDTGLSYEEPSPNTFSFNSPYGACPDCKGLGELQAVDRALCVPDASLPVQKGGLAPLGELRDTYLWDQVRKLARQHKFSLAAPVGELPEAVLDLLLDGRNAAGDEIPGEKDPARWYTLANGGVTGLVEYCYRNTTSEGLRRWAEGFMTRTPCPTCQGARLRKESLWFLVDGKPITELASMDLAALGAWLEGLEDRLSDRQRQIARDLLKEIRERVGFLLNVGLEYLSLDRPARTLSGGESQRIRLATQIGSKLTGITYILDEPSIGLHQRDNHRLIEALHELAAAENTVLVVEHDKDIMLAADHIVDLGPGAGVHGGELVAQGPPEAFARQRSLTADYLSGRRSIPVPAERRPVDPERRLVLRGARGNNLRDVTLELPLGLFTCVTGVSGSGKSTLINETLYPLLHNHVYPATKTPLDHDGIEGLDQVDKVIEIDQSPIGRTPRSNPATYIGVFTEIRQLFARLPESKVRGYKPGRFSFNVRSGRCEQCEGSGVLTIEMNFLPDVYVTCDRCFGQRYNRETLEVLYKHKSIADVLDMPVEDAVGFFEAVPKIHRKLLTLQEVGLGYVRLGQSSTTLSGGEAQRVKLAAELSKRDTGRTVYILDEPTTGLHFEDVRVLLEVLQRLVDKGNTVLVIEHNLDVVKVADHLIDLGPEGGSGGGRIVATGTPEAVARVKGSHTGRFLGPELS
jgi:excinuclease ABC subunit A